MVRILINIWLNLVICISYISYKCDEIELWVMKNEWMYRRTKFWNPRPETGNPSTAFNHGPIDEWLWGWRGGRISSSSSRYFGADGGGRSNGEERREREEGWMICTDERENREMRDEMGAWAFIPRDSLHVQVTKMMVSETFLWKLLRTLFDGNT